MVAPSRLSRESTTRSRFSEQKGHLMAAGGLAMSGKGRGSSADHLRSPARWGAMAPSLLGVQGDVEAQQQLLEIGRVLDLDRQVVHRVDHPVLLVLDLEAQEDAAGAGELGALERHLDVAGQLGAAIAGGGLGGGRAAPPPRGG